MNSQQAKRIPLKDLLARLGHQPHHEKSGEFWYLSPFRPETEPSFKINLERNIWFDFGEGKGGTVIDFAGLTVETAWHHLARGEVQQHNAVLAQAIRAHQQAEKVDSVVLAQLSMTVFLLSHFDPLSEFGIPVYTSGQCGFERVAEVLRHG